MSCRSGKMIFPDLVTTPRRSPSPSKASPSSASLARSFSIRSSRFSGFEGSGMVVREVAVHLAEELDHLAAQPAEERRREGARRAVAAIDRDRHGARELHVGGDAVQVGIRDVLRSDASAFRLDPRLRGGDLDQFAAAPGSLRRRASRPRPSSSGRCTRAGCGCRSPSRRCPWRSGAWRSRPWASRPRRCRSRRCPRR